MDHAPQPAGRRHVDAVVIARAQVQRREVAPVEFTGQRGVTAHQRCRRVVVPLGLHQPLTIQRADLADGAIDRTQPPRVGQRAGTGLQRAGEERIEARVLRDVGLGRLGHVHAIAADEPADQPRRPLAGFGTGNAPSQRSEGLLGQQVLRQHRQAIGHR